MAVVHDLLRVQIFQISSGCENPTVKSAHGKHMHVRLVKNVPTLVSPKVVSLTKKAKRFLCGPLPFSNLHDRCATKSHKHFSCSEVDVTFAPSAKINPAIIQVIVSIYKKYPILYIPLNIYIYIYSSNVLYENNMVPLYLLLTSMIYTSTGSVAYHPA